MKEKECNWLRNLKESSKKIFEQYKIDIKDETLDIREIKEEFRRKIFGKHLCLVGNVCWILFQEDDDKMKPNKNHDLLTPQEEILNIHITRKKDEWIELIWEGDIREDINWITKSIISNFKNSFDEERFSSFGYWFNKIEKVLFEIIDNSIKSNLWIADFYTPVSDSWFSKNILETKFKTLCVFASKKIRIYVKTTKKNVLNFTITDEGEGFDVFNEFDTRTDDFLAERRKGLFIANSICCWELFFSDKWKEVNFSITI